MVLRLNCSCKSPCALPVFVNGVAKINRSVVESKLTFQNQSWNAMVVLLTYIKIPFEISLSVAKFVGLKVWFHVGDLNVCLVWI